MLPTPEAARCFSTKTPSTVMSKSSPVLISSTPSQRPENFYSSVPTYEQHLRPKLGIGKKTHPHDSSRDAWRTCGPGCGRFRWGCVAVPQQKQHQYHGRSLCKLRFGNAAWPHPCGDPDRFQTTGLTSVGSLNRPIQIGIGRYACMVLSPSHAKLSACVQSIEAAIMRHGSIWISSIGAAVNHIMKSMTDEFSSRNVRRHVPMGN